MRISDWSSDVCSSDLRGHEVADRAVAVAVADLVVDALEAVQVEQCQRQRTAIVADRLEHPRHALQQPGAVGQAGEAVVAGHLHQPLHPVRSEEHTSELQSLMRLSYAAFCLKKKKKNIHTTPH